MDSAGELAVQVLCVAVHNHYKRIYNEPSTKRLDSSHPVTEFVGGSCTVRPPISSN